ncbi:MAG: stage II sporulation protein D [Firmicutes bacterium]|nr:stage II sporulation protein D [Bacillota bacterium]
MLGNNDIYIKVYRCLTDKIESLPMEEVVKMMILSEINIDFHIELLKCQTIIARTRIVKEAKCFGGKGYSEVEDCDICDRDFCIEMINDKYIKDKWGDNYAKNNKKLNEAINSTKGLIITYNNKPIDAKYHSTCGGATENSENVTGNQITYLRRVLCDYCKESPYWDNKRDFFLDEIEDKLRIKFPNITPSLKSEIKGFIEEVDKDESGRVLSMKIGGKKFKGTEIRELLGLNSTRFSISPAVISFNTQGKGHGIGFCQYGGNEMAQKGHSYDEILKYYYTGIAVKKYNKPSIKKPLSGKLIMLDPAHGGEDNGSEGAKGMKEKDVVLEVGKYTKERLEDLGAIVILTREDDRYLSLSKRAELANDKKPDFFITLSLSAFPNTSVNGCEIYHYRGDKDSQALGNYIMENLVKETNLINRGVRTAELFLVKEVRNSAIQIFIDYLTNPDVEEKLADKKNIQKISKGIVQGIVSFYKY